jgi:hypothetical protein
MDRGDAMCFWFLETESIRSSDQWPILEISGKAQDDSRFYITSPARLAMDTHKAAAQLTW